MATTLIAVWNARYDRTELVTEAEARNGMLRYARTLGAGTAARAHVEDQALNGAVPANPQQRPSWFPGSAS